MSMKDFSVKLEEKIENFNIELKEKMIEQANKLDTRIKRIKQCR